MREALIVWGGWSLHEPEQCAGIVGEVLEAEGFKVYIEGTTEAFADPAIREMSLIVPICTMWRIEKEELDNLIAAVVGGVGLGGFHGGMGDSFRESIEYQFMCGGQLVSHPGDFIDYRVNILKPDDPIVAGIADFDYHSEQYYMHVDPAIDVLATTTFSGDHVPWIDGVTMPVVWKKTHGKGRVFYSALGHDAAELVSRPALTILTRGLLWAAR
ncbi:MAG: ThuA domain-containing protein [Ancalomicrobiaceae bacterium]|nr:ThuA domain-containing protein [Ancalomicrobiaceae bacterium]